MNEFVKEFNKITEKMPISCRVRVTHKDKVLCEFEKGYSDCEKKIPFNNDSVFTFYSLSKPFCAIGLMKLYDKGLVDLESHPGKYLPEAKDFDSRVKIKHLLHHVSGLPDFEQNRDFATKYANPKHEDLRLHTKLLTEYPMNFIPNEGEMYANVNYVLLALIIENVSKKPYAEYMKKEIFSPLGMDGAFVDQKGINIANGVKGHVYENGALKSVEKSYDWMLGAGDIVGTIDDLYCLNKAIKNRMLLKSETWDKILTPHPLNKMGKGCFVLDYQGKTLIRHNGGHTGFRVLHAQILEDDVDVIVMINCEFDARITLMLSAFECFYKNASVIDKKVYDMDTGYISKDNH